MQQPIPAIDVVVVGAGPAGTAAAIALAEAGYGCVIVERFTFPRHRPGETLHPGIQPLMAQLGCEREFLDAGFVRFPGIYVESKGETQLNEFGSDENGPWLGFQAWREDFDQILMNRCHALGVQVHQPCRAVRPLFDGNRVVGVETSDGPILARFTVDAAGGRHWLANQLRLPIEKFSPKLFARYGYSEVRPTESPLPRFVVNKTGWTWYAQVRDELYHSTRTSICPEDSSDTCPAQTTESERGADVTWRCVRDAAGPGYFLLGDAAAVLDPASSHGVLRALMSGIMAANVVERVVTSPHDERRLATGYCDWWHDWFHHDRQQLRNWYEEVGFVGVWEHQITDNAYGAEKRMRKEQTHAS